MGKRKGTATSSFGVSRREGHDSSPFYSSRLYTDLSQPTPATGSTRPETRDFPTLNQVVLGDSRNMDRVPDQSVHLIVTSPPYNVGKEYDSDLSLDEYRNLLREVFREVARVLVPGGRACINVANVGRRPYLPLHSFIIADMLDLGYLMRGEIIWDKGASSGVSTAWGSWCSASNPILRDVHEYILVFSWGSFSRPARGRESTIERQEFLDYTKSIWAFPTESARRVGHPAPFPLELPRRLIQLYSFRGDVVLDPFCGSGTTCLAARQAGRHYVGYDIDPAYVQLAERRLAGSCSIR